MRYQSAQAVVFVVNSTDDELGEPLDALREELRRMLEVEEDMPRAVGPRRVAGMLSLRTTRVWLNSMH